MERDESGSTTEETPPETAFAALGNKHRIQIIQTLWERRSLAPVGTDAPVPFSELFEASDLPDKGQFNYHLGILVGPFINKSEAGYVLTYAGKNIARAVKAGSVTDDPQVADVSVPGRECPLCGDDNIRMDYEDGHIRVTCSARDGIAPEDPVAPPGAIQAGSMPVSALVGRDPGELYDSGVQWGVHVYSTLAAGYCPVCAGVTDTDLVVCEEHDPGEGVCPSCGDRFASRVRYECTVCETVEWGPIPMVIGFAEPVFGFFYEHGINWFRPDVMESFRIIPDIEETVRSISPPLVEYEFTLDGDTLRVVVDEMLDVEHAETGADEEQSES